MLSLPEGPYNATKWGALGEANACSGNTAGAFEALERIDTLARTEYVSPICQASIYAGLRDGPRVFEQVEKAYLEQTPWLSSLKIDPRYDPMRSDPRMTSLLKRGKPGLTSFSESKILSARLTSGAAELFADTWDHILLVGLLAIPLTSKRGEFELFSQDATAALAPLDPRAWDALHLGLDDKEAQHRKTAIAAIGTIGDDPEAVKLVERGLQDKDSEVRQTAAATLGAMGAHDAIPNLKAALDDCPEVSFLLARALWDLGDSKSRDLIQAVMTGERKDTPGRIHGAMKEAQHKLHSPGELAYMGVKEASGVMLGPASVGVVAIHEAMKESKNDPGAPGRSAAAAILGKDPDPYSLTLLEWGLGDKNWAVRVAVAKALGERGNQQTIPKLSALLSDEHHAVRYMAAASMVKLSLKKPALTASSN